MKLVVIPQQQHTTTATIILHLPVKKVTSGSFRPVVDLRRLQRPLLALITQISNILEIYLTVTGIHICVKILETFDESEVEMWAIKKINNIQYKHNRQPQILLIQLITFTTTVIPIPFDAIFCYIFTFDLFYIKNSSGCFDKIHIIAIQLLIPLRTVTIVNNTYKNV